MFPLGLTTPDFYCSCLLLPLQRESAQNRHTSEQSPGSPGVPSLAARVVQTAHWCKRKSGLNHTLNTKKLEGISKVSSAACSFLSIVLNEFTSFNAVSEET